MTATLIETGTEAGWLEARRHGVTASEISIVMGLSPYDSPFALYHRKRGDLPGVEDSLSMRVGRHNESLAVELFAERHPEFIMGGDGRTLYRHPDRPWQMATPDRLVWERGNSRSWSRGDYQNAPDSVLECKKAVSYDHWGDDGSDEIPVHHRCQVLWQCDVMGVGSWFLACLFLHSDEVRVYEGVIDDRAAADLALMRHEGQLFAGRVGCGDPPDVDWRPQTTAALKHLNPKVEQVDVTVGRRLAISYRAAVRRAAEAEQRKDEMTNRMLQAIGTGRRAIEANTDEVVATRSVYPNRRISTSMLRQDYPDAAKACEVTKDVTKLLPAKPKKDR